MSGSRAAQRPEELPIAASVETIRGGDQIKEEQFTRQVIQLAKLFRWFCWHQRPARTAKGWRSAGSGDVGCPDLLLARRGRVILAELKAERGKLGPGQREWAEAIGADYRLWKPSDWSRIIDELT